VTAASSRIISGTVEQTSDRSPAKAGTEQIKGKPIATPAAVSDSEAWTPDQQKSLEAALAKYPSSLEKNERWSKIAADVDGRSKKECVERFKFIREQATQQKEQAQEAERREAALKQEKERLRNAAAARKVEMEEKARKAQAAAEAKAEQDRARAVQEELDRAQREKEEEEQRIQRQEKDRETAARKKIENADSLAAQQASRHREIDAEERSQNRQLQDDEFVVLESVFPDCFKRGVDEGTCTFGLGDSMEGVCSVELRLPDTYPSLCPPEAHFSGLPLGCEEQDLVEELEAFFVERVGEVILYDWLLQLQEKLEDEYEIERL